MSMKDSGFFHSVSSEIFYYRMESFMSKFPDSWEQFCHNGLCTHFTLLLITKRRSVMGSCLPEWQVNYNKHTVSVCLYSHFLPFIFGLVWNPLGSADFDSVETCSNLLPRVVRLWNVWAVALEKTLTEEGISFLNEGLNGTLPSKDWNYCHMEL